LINYNNFIRGLIIKNKEVVTAIAFMAIIAYVLPYYTVGGANAPDGQSVGGGAGGGGGLGHKN
jgi:hypothetical protein